MDGLVGRSAGTVVQQLHRGKLRCTPRAARSNSQASASLIPAHVIAEKGSAQSWRIYEFELGRASRGGIPRQEWRKKGPEITFGPR
jgi:hypothetical protein